jgi:hypothetical protein
MAENIRGGAPENQEGCPARAPVRQDPQGFQKVGLFLDFVQDDQPPKVSKRADRILEAGKVLTVFEVEERSLQLTVQLSGQRGFAALSGAKKGRDRMILHAAADPLEKSESSDVHD